jgi:uncharacterized membrane protein YoaK (UPF0700 family)
MSTEASTTGAGGTVSESESLGTGSFVRRGALAAALAGVANAVLVLAATTLGVAPGFRPVALPPVLLFTVLGVAGATAVYWLLHRRTSNPDRTFLRVAAVVLVLSLLPDVGLLSADPAATVPGVVVLMAMHVVAAAVSVVVLTGRAFR